MEWVHGKSTVCEILKNKYDAFVISADALTKKLTSTQYIITSLVNAFGEDILDKSNLINSQVLANIVFNDKEKLKILNSIIHPLVILEMQNQISTCENSLIILDVPLPIPDFIDLCTYIIAVVSPIDARINRIIQRNSLSKENILLRINNQLSDEEYKKIADFVICNDKDYEHLKTTVEATTSRLFIKNGD